MRDWLLKRLGIFRLRNEAELEILKRIEKLPDTQVSEYTKDTLIEIVHEEMKRIK